MKSLAYKNLGLTKFIKASGCAAKLDPSGLTQSLSSLLEADANLLSSLESNEDAGVFRLNAQTALVQTLDFITPVVDDPFIYGQIAAANSLSDIFAMGGRALTAMNIVGFDSCHFSGDILAEIMAGGKSKIKECGAVLVGGHSIETPENIYGLSVTGLVDPANFWANNGGQVGDLLILTKPLGGGVLSTALKGGFMSESEIFEMVNLMTFLNFYAVDALKGLEIHAATDVTGFGFLGHLSEMLNEKIGFEIYSNLVPVSKTAVKYADLGLIPAGSYKNAKFTAKFTGAGEKTSSLNDTDAAQPNNNEPNILLNDAQTSGGLIIAVSQNDAYKALKNLKNAGYEKAEIIGQIKPKAELKNQIQLI